mgnify:CR=1 FL=1
MIRYLGGLIYIIALFIIADLSVGYVLNDSVAYICKDPVLHHKYCPGSTRTYNMVEEDGGNTFESYWNQSSIQVQHINEKNSTTNFENYDHILISDSFGAQRQVAYEDSMSAIMNAQEINTVQVGAGSWNFLSYHNFILSEQFKPGATIHILLMANDFYSRYGGSIRNYYRFSEIKEGIIRWPNREETTRDTFKRFLSNFSFVYQNFALKQSKSNIADGTHTNTFIDVDSNVTSADCKALKNNKGKLLPLAESLLMHAYSKNCYDNNLLENIEISQTLLQNIEKYSKDNNVNIMWYFMPNGTFAEDEVPFFKAAYGLHAKSKITSLGISKELARALGKDLPNFETSFTKYKHENPNDILYYPYDGHLNARGSRIAALAIIRRINEQNKSK